MKQGWEVKKLGEVVKLEYGKPLSDDKRIADGKYPVYGANGQKGRSNEFYFDRKTIVIGRKGSAGEINLTEEKFWPLDVTYFVTFDEKKYSLQFLYHLLTLLELPKLAKGVKPGVNRNEVYDISAKFPPLPEQQRIVAILDEAFAAIAKAKANAEQNLKNAKELFESYLQSIFENKGEDWEEKRLGELCKLSRGHNPPKSKFISEQKEGYVRFYQIRDGWADDYAVYVPDAPQLHKVNRDEILMVAYRHIGKVFRGVSGAFNVALCKISNLDRKRLDDDYLFYIIPTNTVKGELMKRSERSLIPSMSVEHLKEILIPLPPLKEQKVIVKKLDALSIETKKLETIYQQKINDLEELKKSILQKAFSGELGTSKEVAA